MNWPEFIKEHFTTVPYFQHMGAKVLKTGYGEATIELKSNPAYANTYGITHGGIVAALVDMTAGVAARTTKRKVLTVEMSASYFQKVELDDTLTAHAYISHEGGRIIHLETRVYKEGQHLVAQGKVILYIIGEDTGEY